MQRYDNISKSNLSLHFFDKSLVISKIFLNFATDSVNPFVWVSGLFTGKGRLRNVIFESQISQIWIHSRRERQLEASTKGVLYPGVMSILLLLCNSVFLCHFIIMRHDVGYLCCLSFECRQCESLRLGMDEK